MKTRTYLYKTYLEKKRMQMISLLEGIGCERLCPKITPAPIEKGFRNRAKFQIFHHGNTVRIRGTDPCEGAVPFERALWILPAWARRIARRVAACRQEFGHDFPFDGFELQLTHGRREAHIILSVKRVFPGLLTAYAEDMLLRIPELIGVAIPSQRIELGDVYLDHRFSGKRFFAHYGSFFQSNLALTPRLLEQVAVEANNSDNESIIDLYCGVGLISLYLANKETKILGVESDKKSVDCASKNAARLGFESASFIHSRVENFVKSALFLPNSLVIINPPRAGCDLSVITAIARQSPNNILCVSCSLETHVRDLALWVGEGYAVASIAAFDMFPFTPFLETVTLLKRNH